MSSGAKGRLGNRKPVAESPETLRYETHSFPMSGTAFFWQLWITSATNPSAPAHLFGHMLKLYFFFFFPRPS